MSEKRFIFTRPFEIKTKGDDITLEGFISTTDKDLVDDVVTVNCLKSMKDQILDRNIKLDVEHEAFRGADNEEKEINKTRIPIGRLFDVSLEGNKLKVKAKINRYNSRFDEVKGSLQERYLDAFSIAYIPTKVSFERKGEDQVRLLDDLILLNVALTGNPVNTTAQIRDIMIKSMDTIEGDDEDKMLKDYKSDSKNKELLEVKNSHSTKVDTNNQKEVKQMTEEETTQTPEEVKPEEPAETVVAEPAQTEPAPEPAKETPAESLEEVKTDSGNDLTEEVKALKAEIEKLKEINNKAITKAKVEQAPQEVQEKSIQPLDLLR